MSWKIKKIIKERVHREKSSLGAKIRTGHSTVLVYPNTYSVGMGNLGFQKIYALINSLENAFCDRSFLPDREEETILERQNTPLFSYETRTALSGYDVVAFSVTFEMDYLHVLKILKLAHIPLKQEDRGEKDPFVLIGGVCATFNPEPLAMFADAFAVGEGEEIIPHFFSAFDRRLPKSDLLKKLAGVQGIYIPSGYHVHYRKDGPFSSMEAREGFPEKIQRKWMKKIDASLTVSFISAPDAVFGDMHLIEINRGCGRHCRFCLAGYIYRPPRYYKFETIKKEIQKGLKSGKKIGLVGSACCDHPEIVTIARYIVESKGEFSVSSLRLESIPEELLALLVASGHKTLAVAPEAGTERLRSAINKPLSDEILLASAEKIFFAGIRNLKLYFLIGQPSEREEDIDAIPHLAKKICSLRDEVSSFTDRGLVTVSVNPFIPKPFTPFQKMGMEKVASLKKKIKRIKEGLKGLKNIKMIHEKPKLSFVQTFLSRGDRRTGSALLKSLEAENHWQQVLQEESVNAAFYVYRDIQEDESLPWDILDTGLKKDYLSNEVKNFSTGRVMPPCPSTPCYRCGDFDGM